MPAIKPSSIRDLKERVSIYDVVSREVTLKRAGSSYKGLSPFTSEKTPSFFISPDKGLYKCFSTGQAGDIISFVMETERLSFVEAVEALAQRFNIALEYEEGGRPDADRSLRQELFELHEEVADFYRERFLATDEGGAWIRAYWTERRKFAMDTAADFKIGFAPIDNLALGQRVIKKGFSREAIEACGLFYTRRGVDARSMGYRFRGRLAIPIRDHQGRIVAFTARQLEITPQDDPSREAKYVNSPETPIFVKGNLLFNLDRARMEVGPTKPFVMVEGQLDAIRCWSVGLRTVVAPQGTGITEQQMRLLKRYEPKLVCLLDGDRAGQAAALRMLPLALAQGIETVFIPLEAGSDPDDIFREGGAAALDALMERKRQPIPFACAALAPDAASLTPQAKAKAARELFAIIDKAESSAAKVEFVKEAAEELGLDARATLEDFERFSRGQSAAAKPAADKKAPAPEPTPARSVYSVERDLLALCMTDPGLGKRIASALSPDWIDASRPDGELLKHVLNEFLHDMWNGPESLNDQLESAELRTLAASIRFSAPEHEDSTRFANEAIRRIVANYAEKKSRELKLEIGRKQASNDADVLSLFGEIAALDQLKRNPPHVGHLLF